MKGYDLKMHFVNRRYPFNKKMTRHQVSPEEDERSFRQFLTSNGLRQTPERIEIMRSALTCEGHFDADILYSRLEQSGYHVSRATLYSTLGLLCDAGLIRKLLFDTHQARYELASSTHSHLICTCCGKIIEIDLSNFDDALKKVRSDGFSPVYASTCIYGLCNECAYKRIIQ